MQDSTAPQANPKKLYLGNLSWNLTEEGVRELCEPFGEVVEVKLITDFRTGRSKGFAFVEFAEEDAAKAALEELNEKEVDGRNIFIRVARPQQPRQDGDRRGGNGGGFQRRSGGGYRGRGNRDE